MGTYTPPKKTKATATSRRKTTTPAKRSPARTTSRTTSRSRTTPKSSRRSGLLARFSRLSSKAQLAVFVLVFGVIGTATLLISQAATNDDIPSKANQLVLSYNLGMPHELKQDDFSTAMPPQALLYGQWFASLLHNY